MSSPLRIGLVGAGKISDQYLGNIADYPDLDVRFVADLVPERAKAQAQAYGVPGFGTMEEALAHDEVELIINLTIPVAHAEVASAALSAGKHVWNEKPIAAQRQEAVDLVAQARSAGLLIGTAPDTFLGPGLQQTRQMIERGDIGRPLTASVVMQGPGPHLWHPDPEFLYREGAGPLFDMGPYYLTALAQLFGPISRVAALGGQASPTRTIASGPRAGQEFTVTVPTYVSALYEFEGGGMAHATFSFDSALARTGVFEVAGSDATLSAPDPNHFSGEIKVIRAGDTDWTVTDLGPTSSGRGIGVVDMARAIRGGGTHRASGDLALHVLDAMFATSESIRTGQFVTVGSTFEPIPLLPPGWDPTERTL